MLEVGCLWLELVISLSLKLKSKALGTECGISVLDKPDVVKEVLTTRRGTET